MSLPAETGPDLTPLTEQIQTALRAWKPRAAALGTYLSDIGAIPSGPQQVSEAGLTVDLPDPLEGFPVLRMALQRAQQRASLYAVGTAGMFRWAVDLQQFSASFDGASTHILAIYAQIGEADNPTADQRAAVLRELNAIIAQLRGNELLLQEAGRGYLAALPGLAEDRQNLGAEAAGLAATMQSFDKRVRELALYYSLQTYGKGMATIIMKIGEIQVKQLNQTLTSLLRIVDECNQAQQAVARLAGELTTCLNNFLAVEKTFRESTTTTFVDQIQQSKFLIASRQWREVGLSALTIVAG